MTDKETRSADAAYQQHWDAIQAEIRKLQAGLRIHRKEQKADPRNWGFVGDMCRVHELVRQASSFINGEEE